MKQQLSFGTLVFSALLTLTATTAAFGTYYPPHHQHPTPYVPGQPFVPGGEVEEDEGPSTYNLQCGLDAGEAVQGISSLNVNIKEMGNGQFQVWGNVINGQQQTKSMNAYATGTVDESIALTVAGEAGEISLRTETDDDEEEFMLGRITLAGSSDEEGLSCSLTELEQ